MKWFWNLIAVGAVALAASPVWAADVAFVPGTSSVVVGSEFEVRLEGRNFTQATEGGGLNLAFTSILQVVSVTLDAARWDVYAGTRDNPATPTLFEDIIFASFNGQSGTFPIATVRLRAVAVGTSPLTLTQSSLNPFAAGGAPLSVALGSGSVSVTTDTFAFSGSESLRDLTLAVMQSCGLASTPPSASDVMTYVGGGSGVGGLAMSGNAGTPRTQQLSPQSRFMTASECQVNNPAGAPNTGTGRALALDAVAIWKDKTEHQFTCTGDANDCHNWPSTDFGGFNVSTNTDSFTPLAANPNTGKDCRVLRYAGCMDLQDLNDKAVLGFGNGVAGIDDGTGSLLGTSGNAAIPLVNGQYCFTHWADALRIIYTGQHQHAGDSSNSDTNNGACALNPTAIGSAAQTAASTRRCNSDVRRTLVETWANIFDYVGDDGAGGCTDQNCNKLKHALRRDDFSGTTDAFLGLIGAPALGATFNTRTFCNGLEGEDLDPIRRICNQATNANNDPDSVCAPIPFANRNAPISTFDGSPTGAPGSVVPTPPNSAQQSDLGLVLSVSVPSRPSTVASDSVWLGTQYNNTFCSTAAFGGAFKFAPMPTVVLPAGQTCPDGNRRVGGQCRWPATNGTATGTFNCSSRRTNRPGGIVWANFDARAYNKVVRNADGTLVKAPANAGLVSDARWAGYGDYRIHQRLAKAGDTGLVPNGIHPACKLPDATEQIGCLVEADLCSIGYAGLAASDPTTPDLPYTQGSINLHGRQFTGKSPGEVGTNWPLLLRSPKDLDTAELSPAGGTAAERNFACKAPAATGWWFNPGPTTGDAELDPLKQLHCGAAVDVDGDGLLDGDGQPNLAALRRVLDPSGPSCDSLGAYARRYPMARLLWLNSAAGLANVTDGRFNAADREATLRDCYLNPALVTPALIESAGLVPLPGGVGSITRFCPP